jgi:hypothetical protein
MKTSSLGLAVLVSLAGLPLAATAAPVPYDVSHRFRILPGGNVVPVVTAATFQHAWVHDPGLRFQVTPAAQPPGFRNDGREFVAGNGQIGQFGLGVPLNEVTTNIPAAGLVVPRSTANVPAPNNSAQANSDVTVNAFGVGGAVSGTLRVHGFADAVVRRDAYAFSSARVIAQGANRGAGGIVWRPAVQSGTLAGGSWGIFDPIAFEMFDLLTDQLLAEGTLLEIVGDGDGTIAWDSDTFSLNAMNARFSIEIPGMFTSQQGSLELEVSAGQVTLATATGLFAGLSLPSIGSPGTFSMPLPSEFVLDYDLDPTQDRDVNVTFDFSGGGSAYIAVPEPATLLLLGAGIMVLGLARGRGSPARAP